MEFETSVLSNKGPGVPAAGARRWLRRIALPNLGLRTSERRLLLFLGDMAVMHGALVLALAYHTDFQPSLTLAMATAKWFITLSVVWVAAALFFDLYDLARAASTINIVRNASAAALATALIYTLVPWFTPPLESRTPIYLFAGAAWLGIVLWRAAYSLLFVQPWFKQRALVVGAGWAGRTLVQALAAASGDANPYRGTGYQLVGFIDDDLGLRDARVLDLPVLGGRDALLPAVQALQVDEVILAITHRHAIVPSLFDALQRCRELGYRVTTMSLVYERLLGRVPVQHLGHDLHMVMRMEESPMDRLYGVFKRVVDLAGAAAALIPLLVLAALVALANRLTLPGPLFYRQQRVGRGGRPFTCIKFRSMLPDAEKHTGAVWAEADDTRVTAVGRVLRRTRLDELPQVINVLRGEMSLIGPRPERPEFVEALAAEIPFYRARHAVRPGITGWAQVRYRYGNSQEDALIKLEYDLYYVTHRGFWLDANILVKTLAVMMQLRGV